MVTVLRLCSRQVCSNAVVEYPAPGHTHLSQRGSSMPPWGVMHEVISRRSVISLDTINGGSFSTYCRRRPKTLKSQMYGRPFFVFVHHGMIRLGVLLRVCVDNIATRNRGAPKELHPPVPPHYSTLIFPIP